MPAAEPTVMDMVLTELRAIRDSIHELRDSMNSKLGEHASQLAALSQWRDSHEQWTAERVTRLEANNKRLDDHSEALSEMNGALRALRWIGGLAIAALGAIEAWLHRGHP